MAWRSLRSAVGSEGTSAPPTRPRTTCTTPPAKAMRPPPTAAPAHQSRSRRSSGGVVGGSRRSSSSRRQQQEEEETERKAAAAPAAAALQVSLPRHLRRHPRRRLTGDRRGRVGCCGRCCRSSGGGARRATFRTATSCSPRSMASCRCSCAAGREVSSNSRASDTASASGKLWSRSSHQATNQEERTCGKWSTYWAATLMLLAFIDSFISFFIR